MSQIFQIFHLLISMSLVFLQFVRAKNPCEEVNKPIQFAVKSESASLNLKNAMLHLQYSFQF